MLLVKAKWQDQPGFKSLLLLPPDCAGCDRRCPSLVEPQVLQGQAASEDISGCCQLHGFPGSAFPLQNDIFEWARDHRVHHKYSETDADPHNARRGFFFSHIGWLFVRKHQDVIEKGRKLDFTDLLDDPVVRFQRKYYKITVVLMCFVLPTLVPWCIWGESLWNAYFLASILRYTISLNVTWLVNSAAHMYGNRPYDKHINPRQNPLVTLGAIGEGFHNYHHTFPYDYSASEFGLNFNPTTWFIDVMCWLGLATDRKRATKPMVEARKAKTGDGST
ncbi:stearoyl-CoA desaturase 5 isoform X2 [Rhinolophus sinicus]|uniref:stearoyl-CoA desaturase 5 isoform X2 n=1 Tax=Rhinolophus sinicus TaxID=89399 RepID=UPI003D7A5917